ncbi:hypothetical protein Glove_226g47 [Diversispora epigaea]|uniref:Reverse transcriptase domain-containing protein n=1 Tax=Diversispora epigaea TaxID=1348612 RepID=A0A397IKQ4_9GLOM|nr:hypothetical protein Glove_226g47 [Diversispora epigaea]
MERAISLKSLKSNDLIGREERKLSFLNYSIKKIFNENTSREELLEALRLESITHQNIARAEKKRDSLQRIQKAIERRWEDLKDNPKRMINSVLDRPRKSIIMDRLIEESVDGNTHIVTEGEAIKTIVKDYFHNWTRKRDTNRALLTKWTKFYAPISSVDQAWYQELGREVDIEELGEIISALPNKKVPGQFNLQYEWFKHLPTKRGFIYPIPKTIDWGNNLGITRPITLLEAGLPRDDTQGPIHLINNIMEDARANKKELENIVLTVHGNTDPYKVEDGLDQGDIISSLMWRIFYDPLISRIAKSGLGYIMNECWTNDLYLKTQANINLEVAVAAYVDDTNWFAPDRSSMEQILNIADEFYTMNDIAINKTKSYLIAINTNKNHRELGVTMGEEVLLPVEKDYPIRSLGVYVTESGSKKFQQERMKKLTDYMTFILREKPITDKQAIYIFNAVVIPMLEYNLNDMTLTESECVKITSHFISTIKNKALLARTAPGALLYTKEAYNVVNLWVRQLQMHSSNLLSRLNDKRILGNSMRIRLQHLQNSFWSSQIVTETMDSIKVKRSYSLLNDILIICKQHELTFKLSSDIHKSLLIKGGKVTIEELLQEFDCYSQFRRGLRKRQILFLEQLSSFDRKRLVFWQELKAIQGKCPMSGIRFKYKFMEPEVSNTELWNGEYYEEGQDSIIAVHRIYGRAIKINYRTGNKNKNNYISIIPLNRRFNV